MQKIRLLFPHIPKTGGTSLLYHFRRQLGEQQIAVVGPHSRVGDFFASTPQFEEMTPEELDPIRVIQGHGVGEEIIPRFKDDDLRLMVVLRHPVSLTRSRFNQRRIGLKRKGRDISAEEFTAQDNGNGMSHILVNHFPSFVDPEAGDDLLARALSVLRKFDYILTTENLDRQAGIVSTVLGIDPVLERRRVAGEARAELAETDEQILARNMVDFEIFQRCNVVLDTDGRTHNPLGYDADGAARARQAVLDHTPEKPDRVPPLYKELGRSLGSSVKVMAAMEWLEQARDKGIPGPRVNRPDLLLTEIQRRWKKLEPKLPDTTLTKMKQAQLRWRKRQKKGAET